MGEIRIRIKFGEHEFEAEGSADAVDRHLETFRSLVAPPPLVEPKPIAQETKRELPTWEKIMRVNGRVISLSVQSHPRDAALAILLGQRHFLRSENVSGREIMEGLRNSGTGVARADLILKQHALKGYVIATGRRRLKRYRLSTDGLQRAQQIARALAANVPSQPTDNTSPE